VAIKNHCRKKKKEERKNKQTNKENIMKIKKYNIRFGNGIRQK
jgi:hypothetical protein